MQRSPSTISLASPYLHSRWEVRAHQFKRPLHVLDGEIGALAVNVEKAVCGSCVEHRFSHGGVKGIGDVDNWEVELHFAPFFYTVW